MRRFKNRDVIEIPLLPYVELKAYVMFIDLNKELENLQRRLTYSDVWLVFDHFNAVNENASIDFNKIELFCNPLNFFTILNLNYLPGSKVIKRNCSYEYNFIDEMLRVKEPFDDFDGIEDIKFGNWYGVTRSTSLYNYRNEWIPCEYSQLNHLEYASSASFQLLPFRIFIEICKNRRISLYALNKGEYKSHSVYIRSCDIPPFMEIDMDVRGRIKLINDGGRNNEFRVYC